MHTLPPRCSKELTAKNAGFSLVEVTLAMGLVSFGLLTILGLMPVGMNTLRQASEQTVESQIVQKIGGEAALTSFGQLSVNFSNKTYFYDDQGRFLTNSPSAAPVATRYWVKPSITNTIYPGSTNAPSSTPTTESIKAVRIDIMSGPNEAALKSTNTYTIQVPNSGN